MASSRHNDESESDAPRVEVLADADRAGGFLLLLERIRQSYVDLDDPTYLEFEYIRWISHFVGAMPPGPLAVTHIGGGGATLVRYIGAVRPGSTHIVLEPDAAVTDLVRQKLPFDRGVHVRIRPLDGRTGVAGLATSSADVVVLDAFSGGRVPAELSTVDFAADVARVLRPGGMLMANVGDGGSLTYTRRLIAGLCRHLPEALLVTEKSVLSGRRYGNIALAASAQRLPLEPMRRGLIGEPFPVQIVTGHELRRWLGGATPFTDGQAERSPSPPEETWRVSLD